MKTKRTNTLPLIPLATAGPLIMLDHADNYGIEIEPGEFLVLGCGQNATHPQAKFTHPNVAATQCRVHEFKHYGRFGRKWWTSRPGKDFFFVVPRGAVEIIPEKGYSYIPARINGVEVSFNVSGGTTGGKGWRDWLHTRVSVGVGHPIRDMRRIAEVAVRGTALEPLAVKAMDEREWVAFRRLMAAAIVRPLIKQGDTVTLGEGWNVPGAEDMRVGKAVEPFTRGRVMLTVRGSFVVAKAKMVNWLATAEANGYPVAAA